MAYSDHIIEGLSRFLILNNDQIIVINGCFSCPLLLWDDNTNGYYCNLRTYYGNPDYLIPEYTVSNGIDKFCPLSTTNPVSVST